MEVVYWQLGVIASVMTAYLAIDERAARWTCLGWTAWTVVALSYQPLMLIQLASAWGTYFVCRSIVEQRVHTGSRPDDGELSGDWVKDMLKRSWHNAELRADIRAIAVASEISASRLPAIEAAVESSPQHLTFISGSEHFSSLIRAIKDSKSTLCILSGWIGSPLLDREVQGTLRSALKRGVRIYIGFGWETTSGTHQMAGVAADALAYLRHLESEFFETGERQVNVAQFPNHEKVIVVDDAYMLIGSNNWLSNRFFRNTERSVRIGDQQLAREEGRRIIALVERAADRH